MFASNKVCVLTEQVLGHSFYLHTLKAWILVYYWDVLRLSSAAKPTTKGTLCNSWKNTERINAGLLKHRDNLWCLFMFLYYTLIFFISNSEEGRLGATAGLHYHSYLSFFSLVDILTASKQALYLGHKTLTNKIWGREYSSIGRRCW